LEAKRNVWSAFFAVYFNAKEYEKSAEYLKKYWQASQTDLTIESSIYYYEGLGKIYRP
jgi:hypothetical protein